MLLQFFWSQTDPDAPISYTTYCHIYNFLNLDFPDTLNSKNIKINNFLNSNCPKVVNLKIANKSKILKFAISLTPSVLMILIQKISNWADASNSKKIK